MIRYLDIQTLELIKSLENIDPFQVSLKLKGLTEEKRKFIASQVAARRKAKTKIPVWQQFDQIIYPGNLSIEQASSAETAEYKSGLINFISQKLLTELIMWK